MSALLFACVLQTTTNMHPRDMWTQMGLLERPVFIARSFSCTVRINGKNFEEVWQPTFCPCNQTTCHRNSFKIELLKL